MYLDTLVAPIASPLANPRRGRISKTVCPPVMQKIIDFVNTKDADHAASVVNSVVQYITREKTFRETVCQFVNGIEARSEAKRLIVCDYNVIVRLKLAIMTCFQLHVGNLIDARNIFEQHGLHRDDAYVYFTIILPRFPGYPKTRQKVATLRLPNPVEVSQKAKELIFAPDATVRRSIKSLIRRKLTFISNNYNVTLNDLEMDVLSASLEGYYLSLPFMASDQHIKASAVSTAKNKINKMISYYQTQKRRQISRDDTTGAFLHSMVSLSHPAEDGGEMGDSIVFHNSSGAAYDVHDAFEMRTSLARINLRERCATRRKAINLLRGRNYDRFKREQERKQKCRLHGYEAVIDELGVKKYLEEVRGFVGMSRTQWSQLLEDLRAAA